MKYVINLTCRVACISASLTNERAIFRSADTYYFFSIAGCGVAKVHLGDAVAGDLVSFLGDSAAAPLHLLGGPGQHVPDQVLPEAVVSLCPLRIQYAGIWDTP